MKKIFVTLAIVAMLASFTACGSNGSSSSSEVASSSEISSTESAAVESGKEEGDATSEAATTATGDVGKQLTIDGAENVMSTPGALAYTTTKSFDEVKSFISDQLKALGASEVAADSVDMASLPDGVPAEAAAAIADMNNWVYSGTYDGDKTIAIVITEVSGVVSVQIQY